MKYLHISRIWTDSTHIHAETTDGRHASYSFSAWPRLAGATEEQRQDFRLSYSGIHWLQIDEDLSFNGIFRDNNVLKKGEQIVWLNRYD